MININQLCILLVITFFFGACSETKWVEIKDDNSNVIEKYMFHKKGFKDGSFEAFYPDGKPKEISFYKQGKLDGQRQLFFENGKIEIEEYYKNDVLVGEYKNYSENGQLILLAHYVDGTMEGLLTKYDEKGNKVEEVTMKGNQENGPFREYHSNGQLHWEGTYLNGDNEFGELKEYNEDGELLKKMNCDSLAVCRTVWTKDKGVVIPKY